jgi:biotin carboxyl carrier protein
MKARYLVTVADKETDVEIEFRTDKYFVTVGGQELEVERCVLDDARSLLLIGGLSHEVDVRSEGRNGYRRVFISGMDLEVRVESYNLAQLRRRAGVALGGDVEMQLVAPMPGLVLDVKVTPGQSITKGSPLLIIEAMKMENVLKATQDGTVKAVHVSNGQSVEKGDKLLEFE